MTATEGDRALALAEHFLAIGQPERALERLTASPVDAEREPDLWRLRAWALTALGRREDARAAIVAGLAVTPDDPSLLLALCDSHAVDDDLDAAERAILAALREAPGNPVLLARYARLAAQAGQLDKASRLVRVALDLAPEEAYVLQTRLLLSHVTGDDRRATELAMQRLRTDPEDTFALRLLSHGLLMKGDARGADRHLAEAARLETDDGTIEALREVRLQRHWALAPLWPFRRFGAIPSWLGAVAIIQGLRMAGLFTIAVGFALVYLALCVYSWVAPPIVRRAVRRRRGLA